MLRAEAEAYRCPAVGQRAAHVEHCRTLADLGPDVALPARLAEAVVAGSGAHLPHRVLVEADLAHILRDALVGSAF